jgi:hypothetical protein
MATRKQRGLLERIYLLDAKYETDEWNLTVKGSSKSVYKIIMSENKVKCKCMDFNIRKNVCKHMYFILGRILKESKILDKINTIYDIEDNFEVISIHLKKILSNHVSNEKDCNFEYNNKDNCSICFEEFGDESVEQCQLTCKNVFHSECVNLWLSQNNSCPLCRSSWINLNSDNPLEEFKGLKI